MLLSWGSWAPLEGATGLGGWTRQEQGPGYAWGRTKSKVPPCHDVACGLGWAGGCCPTPMGSVPYWDVGRVVGRVRAEAPVPDWAREGLWLCPLWLCHCLQAGAWEQRAVLPWGRLAASPVGSLLSSCWLL